MTIHESLLKYTRTERKLERVRPSLVTNQIQIKRGDDSFLTRRMRQVMWYAKLPRGRTCSLQQGRLLRPTNKSQNPRKECTFLRVGHVEGSLRPPSVISLIYLNFSYYDFILDLLRVSFLPLPLPPVTY